MCEQPAIVPELSFYEHLKLQLHLSLTGIRHNSLAAREPILRSEGYGEGGGCITPVVGETGSRPSESGSRWLLLLRSHTRRKGVFSSDKREVHTAILTAQTCQMSATTSKPAAEPASAPPAFSYAQAAKGRSSSGTAPNQTEKLVPSQESTTNDPLPLTMTEPAQSPAAPDAVNQGEAKAEEMAPGESMVNGTSATERQSEQSSSKATSPLPQGEATAQSQTLTSTPSSPSFGTASTSTLPKEDDISSAMNASSDSTWDKQSQTSHGPEKLATHGGGEKENEKESEKEKGQSWEKEMAKPASLKPAPPPALNIWQQRKEAQEAKAKASSLSSSQQTLKAQSTGGGTGLPTGPSNVPSASTVDQAKLDSRRKGRSSISQADEMPTSSTILTNKRKGLDGRDKAREEGNILDIQTCKALGNCFADGNKVTRRGMLRPGQFADTTTEPRAPLAPAPAEDPTSWPTPDTAQDEEKKKVVERGEKGDKEKNSAAPPRGKDKWIPVPHVPTAIFTTPLPLAARRSGGRPARGGKEGLNRGGSHVANSSISGEKWAVGQSGTKPSSGVGETHERGRDEFGSGKPAPMPLRPKQRAMSAGAATPREQRKPIEFAGFPKRKEEPASRSGETTSTFDARRRTSVAAQMDNTSKPRQENLQLPRTETSANGSATQTAPDRGDRDHGVFGETHAHPRSGGADRRAETSFRPVEYFRDSSNNLGPRERGENRSERGRGGYRNSRGASNGVSSSHQGSGHQFSNAHNSHHHNVPSYSTPKAHSYSERHVQQQQQQQQGIHYGLPTQQTRGYRSGPRAQSIPNSAVYARFPNGVQSGLQQLPPIQTDIGAMYGYQSMQPAIMTAMPFSNPYVEQFSVISMVSMQL